ncbi:hypothetical protein K3495_g10100 [Podosphaera aphanis]|nr:hypothetical protein K3495_g10100 [Podosphaera aphanis]
MNFGEMELPSAGYEWPRRKQNPRHAVITPPNIRPDVDQSPSLTSSISIPTTVVRCQSPSILNSSSSVRQPRLPLPPFQSPNLRSTDTQKKNNLDLKNVPQAFPATPPIWIEPESSRQNTGNACDASTATRICEVHITDEDTIPSEEHKIQCIDLEPRSPTPTDRTPYIRFALDQLTRTRDAREIAYLSSETPSVEYPIDRIIPDYGLSYTAPKTEVVGYSSPECLEPLPNDRMGSEFDFDLEPMTPEKEREGLALTRKYRSSPKPVKHSLTFYPPVSSSEPENKKETLELPSNGFPIFIPAPEAPQISFRYPELTFIPMILRPFSFFTLSCACIFMIAFLSVVESMHKIGFAGWNGKMSGRQFFLFRVSPQLLAGLIFIYIQCVSSAITRIMPFISLAANDARQRSEGLFMILHPTIFRPIRGKKLRINICLCIYLLSILIIPLQSAMFTVTPVNKSWQWVTVKGIIRTLIVIYSLILGASIVSGLFFHHRITGLMWDPRSLADIVTMLPRSNALKDYSGTDILKSTEDIRNRLDARHERLGYWKLQNSPTELFYCLGEEGVTLQHSPWKTMDRLSELTLGRCPDAERPAPRHDRRIRYRFIPWYMRDLSVVIWSMIGFTFLLVILTLSFVPPVAIRKGFAPFSNGVSKLPSFSIANILFSFVPSIIGMLLYLLFQPLDMALRILKPWTELSGPEGATADESLLLDYSAALPIQSTLSAISAGHYRIAATSFLSDLFVFIPILSGALFSPEILPSTSVRIMPNPCVAIILLVLFLMYLFGLLLLISGHDRMYLPHGVTCLAEIISFFHNSHILEDAAFLGVRTKAELATRLLAEKTSGGTHRWAFGVFRGRDGKESLGVERVGRSPGVGLMVLSER